MAPSSSGNNGGVVVLLAGPREASAVAEHLRHAPRPPGPPPTWMVGSLGVDLRRVAAWRGVFHGGVFVQPHSPELREFKKFFVRALGPRGSDGGRAKSSMRGLIDEYKEETFGCTRSSSEGGSDFLMPCDDIPEEEVEMRFRQDPQVRRYKEKQLTHKYFASMIVEFCTFPQVSFVVKAVSALTAAFRLAQLERCSETVEASCLRRVRGGDDLHDSILGNLRKLSFSPPMMKGGNKEVEGTQHHFTRNGRLVANKQQVYTVDRFAGLQQVGWYSEDEGLNLDGGVDEVLPTTVEPVYSPLVNNNNGNGLSERERSTFARSVDPSDLQSEASSSSNSLDGGIRIMKTPRELETLPIFSYESFISRTWALVVVSAAIFGFLASLWMLLYVFQKICDGTLAGNQAMGVLLLLGVMALFASVVPWLLPPSETMCALRHFVHPLLLVLCFSILLVKSMQLRSLITIGLGGRIPQVNQLISLFFMVMVQVVIAAEWYLATRPIGIQIIAGYPECGVSPSRFLLLHIYPTVLLLLTFFYGVSVLKVKRNFNEGRWITCAALR